MRISKKVLLTAALAIGVVIVVACADANRDRERFMRIYQEVLIARELHSDSLRAEEEVQKILQKNGFTEQSFREEFIKFAQDKDDFIRMMDTIRNRASRQTEK
ncbi:MAG: hypothetical protein ACM3U1_02785 [Chloroflexota bacterium]